VRILASFERVGFAGGDDAEFAIDLLSMHYNKDSLAVGVTERDLTVSSSEWASSGTVIARGSRNTVSASVKEMPCFRRFDRALAGSYASRSEVAMHQSSSPLILLARLCLKAWFIPPVRGTW